MASPQLFEYKTYLHCRVPRVKCGDCGVHQIEVPWARKQSGFTLLILHSAGRHLIFNNFY
jgi:transposase